MVKPSWPLARISRVTLDNSAPGAKANSQSALARWPVSGTAPTASKVTHPVSLLPCSGHVTPLGSACAETTGVVRSGPIDMSTIRTTMERARWRRGPRRSPFRVSFMRCGVFFTYLKGSLRCLYNAQQNRRFFPGLLLSLSSTTKLFGLAPMFGKDARQHGGFAQQSNPAFFPFFRGSPCP